MGKEIEVDLRPIEVILCLGKDKTFGGRSTGGLLLCGEGHVQRKSL